MCVRVPVCMCKESVWASLHTLLYMCVCVYERMYAVVHGSTTVNNCGADSEAV